MILERFILLEDYSIFVSYNWNMHVQYYTVLNSVRMHALIRIIANSAINCVTSPSPLQIVKLSTCIHTRLYMYWVCVELCVLNIWIRAR